MDFTIPQIYPKEPTQKDMSTDWFVWFRIFDGKKWIQKSYKKGINRLKNYRDRLAYANALRQELHERLKDGWSPFQVKEIKLIELTEVLKLILKLKAVHLKQKTKFTYDHIIGLFMKWLDEKHHGIEVSQFSSEMAQAYMDELLLTRNYSGRTFNDHLIILSTFFNVIIKRKLIYENPFRSIKRMKQTTGRNTAFTDDEKESLRKLIYKKDRWIFYFSQIMYYTFIRRTEMVNVKIGDIDQVNKTIIVRVAKNNIQESVVIPVGLEPILKEMRIEHYPEHFYLFGRHLYPSEVPYSNVNHISTRHNKFCRQLEMDEKKGLYSWKHSGVVAAYYATGKDVYSLMRQLRHRSLETTMIYLKSLGLIQNDVFRIAMIA